MIDWPAFIIYIYATIATPGPNTISSMTNAGKLGLKKALPYNFGIWCGLTVIMLIVSFFCKTLTDFLPGINIVMRYIGASYMLFLAWKMYKCGNIISEESTTNGFFIGFSLQFMNPKVILFTIIALQVYILPYYSSFAEVSVFALLLAFNCFLVTLIWAIVGASLKKVFLMYKKQSNMLFVGLFIYCAYTMLFR